MITTVEVNQKLKVCSTVCSNQIHHFDHRDWSMVGAFLGKKKNIPGGDATKDGVEVVAAQREEDG